MAARWRNTWPSTNQSSSTWARGLIRSTLEIERRLSFQPELCGQFLQLLPMRGQTREKLRRMLANPRVCLRRRSQAALQPLQPPPHTGPTIIVSVERIFGRALLKNARHLTGEIARFRETHIQTLYTHGSRQMRRITGKPHAAISKRGRQPALKSDHGPPFHLFNLAREPRRALCNKLMQVLLVHHRRIA